MRRQPDAPNTECECIAGPARSVTGRKKRSKWEGRIPCQPPTRRSERPLHPLRKIYSGQRQVLHILRELTAIVTQLDVYQAVVGEYFGDLLNPRHEAVVHPVSAGSGNAAIRSIGVEPQHCGQSCRWPDSRRGLLSLVNQWKLD